MSLTSLFTLIRLSLFQTFSKNYFYWNSWAARVQEASPFLRLIGFLLQRMMTKT